MTGGMLNAPDAVPSPRTITQFHFSNNWMANKGNNTAYQLDYAREQGGKIIIVDPY